MPAITGSPAITSSASAGGFGNSVYPTCTWSTLPAASASTGVIFRVTDVAIAGLGLVVISDGTAWVPLGPQLFARSAVAASVTGTTSETTLATATLPAGAMGLNGGIEVRTVWSMTNSANNKTPRVRFGGAAGDQYLSPALTTSASLSDIRRIRNRGAVNSQVGSMSATAGNAFSSSGGPIVTGAKDASAAQDVVISGQLALGSETLTLESYEVWLLP